MKKMIMTMLAVCMMCITASAQTESGKCAGCDKAKGQRPDPTEMIENRTNRMAEKYGLSDKQTTKLLELNKEYMPKMAPRHGGKGMRVHHGGPGMGRPDAQRPAMKDSACCKGQKPEQMDCCKEGNKAPKTDQLKQARQERREQMEQMRTEYDSKLKEIMTSKQYKQYTEDKEKMAAQRKQRGPKND